MRPEIRYYPRFGRFGGLGRDSFWGEGLCKGVI
jgi:hypothetical protein